MPAGTTKAQALEGLRHQGKGKIADVLSGMDFTPGQGIDFDAVGTVLLWVLLIYVAASVFGLVQARLATLVVQRSVFRLREQVEEKLGRLPLSYFDKQQRGEVLSRATNDIDNIAQTLQQTLSQIITSLLTIVGVLAMMFWISWLLALVALVTVPVSVIVATRVGKKAQPQFVAQWKSTGKLNAHIEEMYTGHALVKVFGRQKESAETFRKENDELYAAGFKAQFISGIIQPAMMFIGNLNYVLVAVVGGLRVASGSLSIGDVQAFVQYSRQFSQPLTQVASMANLVQSGVASAERVFELLDAEEQSPDAADAVRPERVRGQVSFEKVAFRYEPDKPLIEDLTLTVRPGQTVAIVGPTGAGKTTLVNLLMRFYETDGGRITLDGVDIAAMSREELRSHIGMVLQDTWLFGGTIADNIAYGAPRGHLDGQDRGGGEGHPRRPLRADPARGLRHGDRRRGRGRQRRREAADHHRPGVPRRARDPGPRRGDELGRHPYGGADPARDGAAADGPDQLCDRPPPLHDPGRGPDPGDGVGADRGAGHARVAAGGGGGVRPLVRGPVRAAGGRSVAIRCPSAAPDRRPGRQTGPYGRKVAAGWPLSRQERGAMTTRSDRRNTSSCKVVRTSGSLVGYSAGQRGSGQSSPRVLLCIRAYVLAGTEEEPT
ncbi:hypothetical protein GCM10020000_35060 [Streptomyces olivoverticillatus]